MNDIDNYGYPGFVKWLVDSTLILSILLAFFLSRLKIL
jgi:hypothetical protein